MQTVTAKLGKLGVCACGFPILSDNIPLGTEYELEPDRAMDCTLHCGGCGRQTSVPCVFVQGRDGGPSGYLPAAIFEPPPEPDVFEPLDIDSTEIEAEAECKRLFIGALGKNAVFGFLLGGDAFVAIRGRADPWPGSVIVPLANLKTLAAMLEATPAAGDAGRP